MIVGKDSAKKGFKWFFTLIIKTVAAVATIAWIKEDVFIGIVGIIAFILFSYEQIKEYNRLSE